MSRMNATTASPVMAPITSANARNTWLSRCLSSAMRSASGTLHQLTLTGCIAAFISGRFISIQDTPALALHDEPLEARGAVS